LYLVNDFFDRGLCRDLRSEISAASSGAGLVNRDGDGVLDESSRRVRCADVSKATARLVRQRLLDLKPRLEEHFKIPLGGDEFPDFLCYGEGAFYRPHRDASTDAPEEIRRRRVSAVVFLNSAVDGTAHGFGGGELTFYGLMDGRGWERCAFTLEPETGLLVAFRSDAMHEVQPVTSGQRFTVVFWFLEKGAETGATKRPEELTSEEMAG